MLSFNSQGTWDSLYAILRACGERRRACSFYRRLREQSLFPSKISYMRLLESCIELHDEDKGSEIHAEILSKGWLEDDIHLGNKLVDMYAKFGVLEKAQEVFDLLPWRDVVSWTTLIAGYTQHNQIEEALDLFDGMKSHGIQPNAHTYACILKCHGHSGTALQGMEIHAEIERQQMRNMNKVIGCTLVDMYGKYGLLSKAKEVFDTLSFRDVATWTALITGYSQHELGQEALNFFQQMQGEGVFPNSATYTSCAKACGSIRACSFGDELYAGISYSGLIEKDHILGSAFVNMYAKCGLLQKAHKVFDMLKVHDTVSWNALMAGYLQHEESQKVLWCFEEMDSTSAAPDAATFALTLNACSKLKDLIWGKRIHAKICETNLLERHHELGNSLVAMYATCGMLAEAEQLFDNIPAHDVIAWTALMAGFTEHNCSAHALQFHQKMVQEGILPDTRTHICCLKACGICGSRRKGKEIHSQILQMKLLSNDDVIGTALVSMYANVGMLTDAGNVFDKLQAQDVFPWTQLIAGYIKHNLYEETIYCFEEMQQKVVLPDSVTFTHLLKACGGLGDAKLGKQLHLKIQGNELMKKDLFLNDVLVDMYAKCGMLTEAQKVFDDNDFHDDVSWTSLITGYAQQARTEEVICIFDRMREQGKKPNLVTFISVLTACSHAGFIEKGVEYFETMVYEYNITPNLEHYTCIVDLLGRAGQLRKAVELMAKMSLHSDIELWLTILGSCQRWGNVDIARQAFEQVLLLDKKQTSAYICMHNIYAQAGMHEDAINVESLRYKNHAFERPD